MSGGGPAAGLNGHPGGAPKGDAPGGRAVGLYGHCIPLTLEIISAAISGENGPNGPIDPGGGGGPSGPPGVLPFSPLKLNGGKEVVGEEEVDVVDVPDVLVVVVGNIGIGGKEVVGGMMIVEDSFTGDDDGEVVMLFMVVSLVSN